MSALVLIVEDEPDLLETLEYNLQKEGYATRVAPDGASALNEAFREPFPELKSRQEHVELLIQEEEASFARTLGRGLSKFEELAVGSIRGSQEGVGDIIDVYEVAGLLAGTEHCARSA